MLMKQTMQDLLPNFFNYEPLALLKTNNSYFVKGFYCLGIKIERPGA